MKPVLALVALFFVLVGTILLRAGLADPSSGMPRATVTAPLAEVRFDRGNKIGHFVELRLEGVDETWHVTRLERAEGLEERLRAALRPGVPLSVTSVERDPDAWTTPEGVPLTALELRRGEEVLLDSRTFETLFGLFIGLAVPLAGGLGILAGVGLLLLAVLGGRRGGPRPARGHGLAA